MIRITKHIRISILTVVVFVMGVIFHYPPIFYITYAVMALHELSHLVAAVSIGLSPDYIALMPFGLNLRLKNKIVCCLSDEIILYLAGPFINAILALAAAIAGKYIENDLLKLFYISNITLFIMNMLPLPPLDGGMLVKRIISRRYGQKTAEKICVIMSAVFGGALLLLGIYIAIESRYNYSLVLFSLLILGNIFTQREKYDIDFIGELMYYSNKSKKRVCHITSPEGESVYKIASRFRPDSFNVVYITDTKGKIKNTLTETQILDSLTKKETPEGVPTSL